MKAITLLALLLLATSTSFASNRDSLMNAWANTDDPEEQVQILYQLTRATKNPNTALKYAYQTLDLAEKLENKEVQVDAYASLAQLHASLGSHAAAVADAYRGLDLAKELGDDVRVAELLGDLGYVYDYDKQFDEAIKYINQALEMCEQLGMEKEIARLYGNLGSIYQQVGDLDRALHYDTLAINGALELGLSSVIASNYDNLGSVYKDLGEYERALEYYYMAINMKEGNDDLGLTWYYNNIGLVHLARGEYVKAEENAMVSLNHAQRIGSKPRIEAACLNLSDIYTGMKDYQAALLYHKMAADVQAAMAAERTDRELAHLEMQQERMAEQEAKMRQYYIQYFFIFLAIIGFILLGYITIRLWYHIEAIQRYVNLIAFAGLLLMFEFILVVADPVVDEWTDGVPVEKLGINMTLALMLALVHTFVRRKWRLG